MGCDYNKYIIIMSDTGKALLCILIIKCFLPPAHIQHMYYMSEVKNHIIALNYNKWWLYDQLEIFNAAKHEAV